MEAITKLTPESAFKIAASMALKEAASKCDPVILEPIMKGNYGSGKLLR